MQSSDKMFLPSQSSTFLFANYISIGFVGLFFFAYSRAQFFLLFLLHFKGDKIFSNLSKPKELNQEKLSVCIDGLLFVNSNWHEGEYMSFLNQILSADFLSKISKLFWR